MSAEGVFPDPIKLKGVQQFSVQGTVRVVREFIGLAGDYRRFVPNFAKVAAPLHALTRQDVPFVWTEPCNVSFEELKSLLTSPRVLVYPDFDCPFVLQIDASTHGLGAVLEQEQPDRKLNPVAYASRSLRKGEVNYGVTKLEALA